MLSTPAVGPAQVCSEAAASPRALASARFATPSVCRHAVEPRRASVKVPAHQRFTLDNGVKLILIPLHQVPLIAFEALVRGGATLDPNHRPGLAALAAELLTHGAGSRDAYAFADAVEGVGGMLGAEARSETIVVHGQFLARDRALMLTLLADALQRPRFDTHDLKTLRTRRIEFIKAAKDCEPQHLIGAYGRALLFGAHPYAKPVEGSERGLAAITRQNVLEFYQQQMGADRLTLVFAGDFDTSVLKNELISLFSAWRPAAAPLKSMPAPKRVHSRRVLLIDAPASTQTHFWIGNVGVARSYAHRAALEVTNTAFGGSFGSMLMQALRVKSGLTYSVNSTFRRGSVAGEYAISSFTQTATTARALEVTLQSLGTLKQQGVSDLAIDSARSYLLGQYPLGFETATDWAAALADLDLYQLTQSYIDDFGAQLSRVDAASAREVIATAFPSSDEVDIVLIGDAARIRDAAANFGTVIEKPLAAPDFALPAH